MPVSVEEKKGKSDWTVQAPDGCSHPPRHQDVVPNTYVILVYLPSRRNVMYQLRTHPRVRTKLVRSRYCDCSE